MPANQMRKLSRVQLNRGHCISRKANASTVPASVINIERTHVCRSPTDVKDAIPASTIVARTGAPFSDFFFGISRQTLYVGDVRSDDVQPPDPRTLKLGKTVRILHERLPTLLLSPLPQEILSPQITLHLFPSTHPHLPTVSGRIAYTAALWTAPVAWGRVPVVGNVKLKILSERMYKNGSGSCGDSAGSTRQERLIVRWRTCKNDESNITADGAGPLYRGLYRNQAGDDGHSKTSRHGNKDNDHEFSGLFVFEFDEHGRILSHTIEHSQEGGNWDKMPRMINVTDWLLQKALGKKLDEAPGLALGYCEIKQNQSEYVKCMENKES